MNVTIGTKGHGAKEERKTAGTSTIYKRFEAWAEKNCKLHGQATCHQEEIAQIRTTHDEVISLLLDERVREACGQRRTQLDIFINLIFNHHVPDKVIVLPKCYDWNHRFDLPGKVVINNGIYNTTGGNVEGVYVNLGENNFLGQWGFNIDFSDNRTLSDIRTHWGREYTDSRSHTCSVIDEWDINHNEKTIEHHRRVINSPYDNVKTTVLSTVLTTELTTLRRTCEQGSYHVLKEYGDDPCEGIKKRLLKVLP